ncbi:LytTR family DNA-binding domain-containing protein [Galbibacter sp. EGI 63066]|uniref:LytR/AlgR family response regulator transcription factor n=1 Tax=Galbibacter sp. EGI 63066 TaxID=2993559 RepID=UPI0022499F8C|nr:LytTR family DNA-binding domain-containing protein [Galbibacter sp. EGI 63066]MCX2679213.1 LytTR family DNA-binding domain-containing protein [Galbibacter sp. EGI 63066]
MKMNCIIVDDSSIQRMSVARLIKNHPMLNLVAEYSNAIEARNGLKNQKIDLIFLDIEMPVVNGFDLLEALSDPPQVILITGSAQYALKAFDYDVTDYLHKPITQERFEASVKRAQDNFKLKVANKEDDEHIFVKSNLKKRKVFLNEINWVEALGDYIKLVTEEANIVILSTMKSFEKQLPEDRFLRIHKSYIVNLDKVEKFNSKNVEVNGKQIPLSRNKKQELSEALSNS